MEKDKEFQIKLINQALSAAFSSISLAKQLLAELSQGTGGGVLPAFPSVPRSRIWSAPHLSASGGGQDPGSTSTLEAKHV